MSKIYPAPVPHAHDQAVLNAIEPLRAAGFALLWLHPRSKRPIGDGWSSAPVASLDDLRRTHASGNNVGVRLGEPSELDCGYWLHVFDLDIRVAEQSAEAWDHLRELLPDVNLDSLPCVQSGSGGESRHLHFLTDKPFFGKKLATSGEKYRGADGKWHFTWEIELFGTGKQVALPPSIHPDTGKPYLWLRPFDFTMLDMGVGPVIPSATIELLATATSDRFEFETRDPLAFEPGQLERDLDDLPLSHLDDYHEWVMIGQALHHQFGASDEGFELWVEHSKRSEKFDSGTSGIRTMRTKWRGFGRNRRQPVTMGTIRQWAIDARRARMIASFDEEGDDQNAENAVLSSSPAAPQTDVGDCEGSPARLGTERDWTTPPCPITRDLDIDDLLGEDDEADTIDAIGSAAAAPSPMDWMSFLDFNESGAIKSSCHNVTLIVTNDPRFAGLAQYNELTQETVQRKAPGLKVARRAGAKPILQLTGSTWNVRDERNGELWSDTRDFAVRAILEAPKTQGGYGMKVTDRDLRGAIDQTARLHRFHPVREYLMSLKWDGAQRVDHLFVDYLGAEESSYSRQVARLMMIAAVTRVFEPGHKFDFAIILEGLQGKKKSTFIRTLARFWFVELDGDFHDPRQMIELMQGAWILEIPELTGFSRADVRAIKAFISRQEDKARLAYARRAQLVPRQCIFIGSTNDKNYLRDATGGRRFWPMPCSISEIDIERLEQNVDQLWAEALTLYRAMRAKQPLGTLPLYLTDDAHLAALHLQEDRREETEADGLAGRIAAWLDRSINNGGLDDDQGENPRVRQKTCLAQIYVECLGNEWKSYGRGSANLLREAMDKIPGWVLDGNSNFEEPYAKQRTYWRGARPSMKM